MGSEALLICTKSRQVRAAALLQKLRKIRVVDAGHKPEVVKMARLIRVANRNFLMYEIMSDCRCANCAAKQAAAVVN